MQDALHTAMDTLGIEPRASRMLSGCDTTTPRALEEQGHDIQPSCLHSLSAVLSSWRRGCKSATLHLLWVKRTNTRGYVKSLAFSNCISGLVVEYIVAIDVTRVRFPADANRQRVRMTELRSPRSSSMMP